MNYNGQPNRAQLRAHRQILWGAWQRAQQNQTLDVLQTRIVQVIRMHSEYHALFNDEQTFLDKDITTNTGHNPYLHLSLHLAIEEQLALHQPVEVSEWLEVAQTKKLMDRHAAVHAALDVLGDIMADAQQRQSEPDVQAYTQRIHALIES